MTQPYDRTTYDGKTVDWLTRRAINATEHRLGYTLSIIQGSYHKGVGASAGTHDGGGVIDLLPWDHERKVRALRTVGFAAWHRTAIRGVWPEHIHAVLIGDLRMSAAAARQVYYYRLHRSGLVGEVYDPTWHPNPIPQFRWVY